MKQPRISVITPTFNRAHTLPALRASLVAQDFSDFEWILVDDGSSDSTPALLEAWKREGGIDMAIISRENGGKHRALNSGIPVARGEWIFIVDSDDRLPASSLRILDSFAREADSNPHACGVMGLKAYSDGTIVGEKLPDDIRYANALELTYRYGIRGDKAEAYKADVLKKFPFPEFEGERFLTEAVVWYRMARAGWTLLLCREILYESIYHADGLSAQSLRIRKENPKGTLLFYKEEIEGGLPLSGALREAANYVRFSLHAWRRDQKPKPVSDPTLHVLHVINSLAVGGAERLLSDLLPLMQKRGIRNTVLALDEEGDVFSSTLRSAGIDVIFAGPNRDGDSTSKRGASAKTRIFSPARIIDVVKTIRAIQPSLVHSHLAPSFHWCAAASLVCRDPVYVTTEHASENHRMSKPFLRGVEKFCYSRYTSVFCVSDSVAEAMSKWLGLPDEKLPVILNGISLERFRTEKQAARDVVQALAGRTGIAMTARFVPAKDHGTAIRALVRLPERYALVLIGDGPERATMEMLADGLDVNNRCLFLGSRTDVPEILAACGVYMQTSIMEGFGIAALEAMAAGLPIVATDAPGLGPLVRGVGILVAPGDFDALASAVLGLDDEITKKRMKTAAIERIGRYSIDRTADEYDSKYRELCPGSSKDVSSRKDAT